MGVRNQFYYCGDTEILMKEFFLNIPDEVLSTGAFDKLCTPILVDVQQYLSEVKCDGRLEIVEWVDPYHMVVQCNVLIRREFI